MVPSLGFSSWDHMNLDYKDNEYLFKNTACQVFEGNISLPVETLQSETVRGSTLTETAYPGQGLQ